MRKARLGAPLPVFVVVVFVHEWGSKCRAVHIACLAWVWHRGTNAYLAQRLDINSYQLAVQVLAKNGQLYAACATSCNSHTNDD